MDSASPNPRGSDSASTSDDSLRLARPPGLGLNLDLGRRSPPRPTPGARTQPRPRKTVSASPDPRARTQPRPRTTVSASPDPRGSDSASTSEDGLRLARPPGPDSASTSEEPPPRPTLGSDRPRHRGGIITLPLASSGYGEQDRRPIWLAPVNK
jgi:hypothetical protein